MEHLEAPHIPVLLDAVLESLRVRDLPDGRFVDGTLGAGGHAAAILTHAPRSRLIGFDRDPAALAIAMTRLAPFGERATIEHESYETIGRIVPAWLAGESGVDGILLDLGISSMQVDDAERGFAFMREGPLDMRFDPTSGGLTAADLVNAWDANELADILFRYGEERHSRALARAIINHRPILSTRHLAQVIEKAQHGPREKIHPATRTFQALRIAVNDELGAVERVLPVAISLLKPGGRLAVISFHSLEDRIVKQTFKEEATDCLCPPPQPICTCEHTARVALVTRKPIQANDAEITTNPRSRSAKLRVIEKLAIKKL